MENITTAYDDATGELVIRAKIANNPGKLSASGKSKVLATTRGNASIDTPEGPVSVGLNVYRKAV